MCCWPSTARRSNRRRTSSSISTGGTKVRGWPTRCCGSARSRRCRSRSRRRCAAARCTSCSPPSGCSRCWSARRCGCAVRAIRRRCISSGSASPSSACSPSPSTARSIASTGCSTGATRLPSRCCRRCCCTSRWCFPQRAGREASPRRHSALMLLMYVPALVLGAARVIAVARASRGSLSGPLFSRVLELLDRSEPMYLLICAVAALAVLVRGFQTINAVTGRRQLRWIAWGTALGVGPFAFGYALPWAFGANPPLALQLTAIPLGLVPLTFASAIVRYRLRDVEVIIKRGLAYTAFFAASVALYCRAAPADRLCLSDRRRSAQLDRRAAGDAGHRPAGAPGQGGGAERARPRVLPRPLRLPPRAGRVRARSEQRPRHRPPQPAAGDAHRRDAGARPDGADARARRRRSRGEFVSIGDYGFPQPVPRLSRDVVDDDAAGWRAHHRPRRPDRRRAFRGRGSRVLARCRHLLLRAVRLQGAHDRGARARPQGNRRAVQQRGSRRCSPPSPARWRRQSRTAACIGSCT